MALMVPSGPSFANYSDNFGPLTADGTTGFGVGVAMGTSNADGSDTAILSALAHDCEYLWIGIANTSASAEAPAALMDLLVDPAGGASWSNLITDLLVGGAGNASFNSSSTSMPLAYHFPLWIPAGSSLGARIRRQSASARTARVMIVAAGGNKNPASWWCGQRVESITTFDAANSLGQLHTPGESGAFSSWTNLGSPNSARAGAAQWAVNSVTGASMGASTYDYQFGVGGVKIGPRAYVGASIGEVLCRLYHGPIFCDIPAGTQLQVRAAASGTLNGNQTNLDCAAYLVQ